MKADRCLCTLQTSAAQPSAGTSVFFFFFLLNISWYLTSDTDGFKWKLFVQRLCSPPGRRTDLLRKIKVKGVFHWAFYEVISWESALYFLTWIPPWSRAMNYHNCVVTQLWVAFFPPFEIPVAHKTVDQRDLLRPWLPSLIKCECHRSQQNIL